MCDGDDLIGGIFFVVFVCFKYLFVIVGLIYFVYILWYYCWGLCGVVWFCVMVGLVMGVVILVFGLFVYYGEMF